LRRLVFENNAEGFEKLKVQTKAIRVQNGFSKMVFGLESTACLKFSTDRGISPNEQRGELLT
jgi:hypothetical protein